MKRSQRSCFIAMDEHENNAQFLPRAEHLTQGYHAPVGAAATSDRPFADLVRFAEDLAEHVFLGEHALFPQFEASVRALAARGSPQR